MPNKRENDYTAWLQKVDEDEFAAYVTTRYAGDYPEFTLDECKKGYEAALRVKEYVIEKIYGSAAKQI